MKAAAKRERHKKNMDEVDEGGAGPASSLAGVTLGDTKRPRIAPKKYSPNSDDEQHPSPDLSCFPAPSSQPRTPARSIKRSPPCVDA